MISGNTVAITGAGLLFIRAHQDGDTNYLAAPTVLRTFTVSRGAQKINFASIPKQTVGATIHLSATASSGLPVTYTGSKGVTISGNTVTVTGAGLLSILAHQDGNTNYLPAPTVSRTFVVSPRHEIIKTPAIGN